MANKHLVKLWVLTLLLAPFFYAVINLIKNVDGQIVTLLEVFPITLIFSFLFSLPTLLITYLTNKFITEQNCSTSIQKIVNISLAGIGLTCTLLIIKGSLIPTLIKTYIISLLISAIVLEIYYKMKHKRNTQTKFN